MVVKSRRVLGILEAFTSSSSQPIAYVMDAMCCSSIAVVHGVTALLKCKRRKDSHKNFRASLPHVVLCGRCTYALVEGTIRIRGPEPSSQRDPEYQPTLNSVRLRKSCSHSLPIQCQPLGLTDHLLGRTKGVRLLWPLLLRRKLTRPHA